jgi:hypothetical protein
LAFEIADAFDSRIEDVFEQEPAKRKSPSRKTSAATRSTRRAFSGAGNSV